ncbi:MULTISPECIES: DUF4142 domain-containing protein [Nostocales]|uniref:DUF4142 domain-containing protein n=3 Tax=Nostocales TaxID=1161 RepID=A0A8S9T646_9CYAN|nr:DUF4142 domain-containing protein [Tolypothrix bouteillei]KAF3886989.1 DUF4142 domain-containing protein [Tolypothrix bouteillei VB521301]
MLNFKKIFKFMVHGGVVKCRNTLPALLRTLIPLTSKRGTTGTHCSLQRAALRNTVAPLGKVRVSSGCTSFRRKAYQTIAGCIVIVIIIFLEACSVTQVNKPTPPSNEPVATQSQFSQQSSSKIDNLDWLFVIDAFQGGTAEIELGKQALQKSTNPKVKEFAQQMIEEHTKTHEKLLQLLNSRAIAPPTTLGFKYETIAAHLQQLSGTSFDEPYINEMGVNRHLDAIATFQRERTVGKDPDFKAFASKGLQTARNHFQMAVTVTGYGLLGDNK